MYFLAYPSEGVELHRVARAGGEDEKVISSEWSLARVIVDDDASLIPATARTILRQPKDGSQRTVLATAGEHGVAT